MEAIAKRIVEQPWRSVALAALAGAWLGYESPRRGIVMGALRMLVLSELRGFVDGMPAKYAEALRSPLANLAQRGVSAGGLAQQHSPRVIPS